MKIIKIIAIFAFIILTAPGRADAGGPFGPPEPISKGTGGLHTGIGYWFHEDRYQKDTDHLIRQNQVYSELGYASGRNWEVYTRVGLSRLTVLDAFHSTTAATTAAKDDFDENWKFFSTLGVKGFYPFNETFGIGAFVQGTYCFSDFTDNVSGQRNGIPFTVELGVKNLWDVNLGVGLQATVPQGIKMYLGPYAYYSEAKVSPSSNVPGLPFASGEATLQNQNRFGGFGGIDVPLGKGFRLDVEGRYSERLSAGAAVTYTY